MDMPLDIDDVIQDSSLFAMKTISTRAGLGAVDDAEWTDEEDEAGVAIPATRREALDRTAHADSIEAELDAQYEEYRERKGMRKARVRLKSRTKVLGEAVNPNEDAPDTDYIPNDTDLGDGDEITEPDADVRTTDTNPLIMARDDSSAAESTAALWFSQSQFADLDGSDDDDSLSDGDGDSTGAAKQSTRASATDATEDDDDTESTLVKTGADDSDDDSDDSEPDFEEISAAARAPAPTTRKNLDAHGLALAAEMILRKRKRDVIDSAYNRWTFNDPEMPAWFEDEETTHKQLNLPVTKEMAADIKAREREINQRPIKKVLEAKARKKRRVARQLEKLKAKATAITESETMTDREKTHQIQALYKKAKVGDRHEKPTFVRAKKGHKGQMPTRPAGASGKVKVVDRRFKSDLAGKKRLDQKRKRGRR